ncbi:MAG: ATP-binding protein [Saccharofermentanales bacterium]|jgi:signal transduction histidine kinase|nr:HAMP domain-containing sensor histidine kinase [Bacillota bacterium]
MLKGFINRKLQRQWVFYFVLLLLVFALLSTLVYTLFYRKYLLKTLQEEWQARGRRIAATLSEHKTSWETQSMPMESQGHGQGQGVGKNQSDIRQRRNNLGKYKLSRNSYLKMLNDAIQANIWVLDRDSGILSLGEDKAYSFTELPADAVSNLDLNLQGQETVSTDFSDFLGIPALTLGFPIIETENTIQKALLLHVPLNEIPILYRSSLLGFSAASLIAISLVLLMALILSRRFIVPIKRIQDTTARLALDDYSARTGYNRPDELGELAREIDILACRLQTAREEREQEDNLRRSFISEISHELRTPVAVIRGSIEALSDGIVRPEEIPDYIDNIKNDIKALDRLVNDLLELSRLDHKEFSLDLSTVRLSDIVADALRSIRHLAAEKAVELVSELDHDLVVEADYGRIRQLCLILLDNALKYSPSGSKIEIVLAKSPTADAVLSVTDYGEGMSEEVRQNIFDRFYTAKKQNQDIGLGLTIAASIAKRHGMAMEVDSRPGRGSVFKLLIPKSLLKNT